MKIKFTGFTTYAGDTGFPPSPAVKSLPSWYSSTPRFTNNGKKFKFFSTGKSNTTIKWCNPFLDSLSAGYVVSLEHDIIVSLEGKDMKFAWKSGGEDLVSTHSIDQIPKELVPPGFSKQPFKFKNNWSIQTPKGYSALFVHPLNRTDLPFITLSGFVDNDEYKIPVNFPFLIRDDFEGIIPAGTPIAQVIPIKRESWTGEIKKFDADFIKEASSKFDSTIYRAYKNLFWKRKDYR